MDRGPPQKSLGLPSSRLKMPTCLSQHVPGEWSLASEELPKFHQRTTTWKQVFNATTKYRTFIMRYGFRTVPTDGALAWCPSRPPPSLWPLQCAWGGVTSACTSMTPAGSATSNLPAVGGQVAAHHGVCARDTHAYSPWGRGLPVLFLWPLKEPFLTSGGQIPPRS